MITCILQAWQDLAMQDHGHVIAVAMAVLVLIVGLDFGVLAPAVFLDGLSHVSCRKRETGGLRHRGGLTTQSKRDMSSTSTGVSPSGWCLGTALPMAAKNARRRKFVHFIAGVVSDMIVSCVLMKMQLLRLPGWVTGHVYILGP